jgi:hypothetical protein
MQLHIVLSYLIKLQGGTLPFILVQQVHASPAPTTDLLALACLGLFNASALTLNLMIHSNYT